MPLEAAQLLSTAHHVVDGEMQYVRDKLGRERKTYTCYLDGRIYKATHINHPTAVWVRKSRANYMWTYYYFSWLLIEYERRFQKKHASRILKSYLYAEPRGLWEQKLTTPPLAMPDEYKVIGNVVKSYRNYYKFGKADLHGWTNREPPDWII